MEREWTNQIRCPHALSHCETSLPDDYMETVDIDRSGDEGDVTAGTCCWAGTSMATLAKASSNVTGSNF